MLYSTTSILTFLILICISYLCFIRFASPVISFSYLFLCFYDIITAKEKQATQSGICFSCGINEQTSDEIGQRALKAQVCEYDIMSASKPEQAQPVHGKWRYFVAIQRELLYKEFVQRENEILRAPYNPELEFYSVIKSGNVARVRELCRQPLHSKEGLGTLSDHPLQNMKFHFVITTALVARYCIEGGMELAAAYSLSDFYIQKADRCKTLEEISGLHPVMCEDYAKRMKNLQKKKVCSRHIAECIDYIYDHLHTRITVTALADLVGLNETYLSRLFQKEVGSSISEYIKTRKIETAQNMLVYSDFTPAQIAATLAFPSQSYFSEVFKKRTGLTPTKYRALHFRNTEIH